MRYASANTGLIVCCLVSVFALSQYIIIIIMNRGNLTKHCELLRMKLPN